MNYIIGGGVAGLTKAFLFEDYKIFDANPLGQIGGKWIFGPRIIKVDEYSKLFFDSKFNDNKDIIRKEIKILYHTAGNDFYQTQCDDNFKSEYSFITRGHRDFEKSYLSSGQNSIEIFFHKDPNVDIYRYVFEHMLDVIKSRGQIIECNVKFIDTIKRRIITEDEQYEYSHVINTSNLNIFRNLVTKENFDNYVGEIDLSTENKNFLIAEQLEDERILISEDVHYVYSIGGVWTRKTLQNDYTVYEVINPYTGGAAATFEGTFVRASFNNIPIQIKKSAKIKEVLGIDMLGRYAEWDHSIKFNEVLGKVIRCEK